MMIIRNPLWLATQRRPGFEFQLVAPFQNRSLFSKEKGRKFDGSIDSLALSCGGQRFGARSLWRSSFLQAGRPPLGRDGFPCFQLWLVLCQLWSAVYWNGANLSASDSTVWRTDYCCYSTHYINVSLGVGVTVREGGQRKICCRTQSKLTHQSPRIRAGHPTEVLGKSGTWRRVRRDRPTVSDHRQNNTLDRFPGSRGLSDRTEPGAPTVRDVPGPESLRSEG